MADRPVPERFITIPVPSKDDGSKTLYEQNVERVLAEQSNEPPAEPA